MPHVLIISPDPRQRRLWSEWMAGYPDLTVRVASSIEEGLEGEPASSDVIVAPLEGGFETSLPIDGGAESPAVILVADGSLPDRLLVAMDRHPSTGLRLVAAGDSNGSSALLEAVESLLDLRQRRREHATVQACCVQVVLEYELDNDKARIAPLIEILLKRCDQFGLFDDRDRVRAQISLEEALLNAVIHGNLEVDSKLREQAGDEFGRMIALRQSIPRYADRRVTIRCELDRQGAAFRIRDEGPGFDVSKVRDCRDSDRLAVASGRGVLLMRSFMDQVTYNATGNEVQLRKGRSASRAVELPSTQTGHPGAMFTAAR